MASGRPSQESIQTFTSITGASESVALQKLEEFRGNLQEAVNAYFSEGYRHNANTRVVESPRHIGFDMNNQIRPGSSRLLQLFSAARTFKPSSLLDSYRRSLLNGLGASSYSSHAPIVPHTGEVMGNPVELNSENQQLYHPGGRSSAAYDSTNSSPHGLDVQLNNLQDDFPHLYGNNVEEEMIQAALEASKRDAEEAQLNQLLEGDELSRAVSLSLKTAEQENAMCEQEVRGLDQQLGMLNELDHFQHKDALPSNEWGGISSKELDEAIMLETALFSANSEGTSHSSKYEPHQQSDPDGSLNPNSWPLSHVSSSSSVTPQRLLREQQDNEYIASLLADREKEANALKQADSLHMKEDESRKKLLEEEKLERWLAVKETLLPPEPASNDENAVTLLVRMPDGTRRGRRFLKSDKLKFLFDFIDVGRTLKPGTYRVVMPYPRRAFNVNDGSLSLTDVGLTSKQEALFLEFV